MDDDFDTPAAVAVVFEHVRDANVAIDAGRAPDAGRALAAVRDLTAALGIELRDDVAELDENLAGTSPNDRAGRPRTSTKPTASATS